MLNAQTEASRIQATQGQGQQTPAGDQTYRVYEPDPEDAAAIDADRQGALARATARVSRWKE